MIDRATIRRIREDALAALKVLEDKYKVVFEAGAARYGATGKLTFAINPVINGEVVSPERDAYILHAGLKGLNSMWLDKCFTFKDKQYRITGYKPSRPKYPVQVVQVGTNRQFKFPINLVVTAMKKEQ